MPQVYTADVYGATTFSAEEILEGSRRGPSRGTHISRSKSTMGFEAGQRMRAISVYSGRAVVYNGGEADVRLRGMNVPVARLQIYPG